MVLPNAAHAIIERAKLKDYLLWSSHPVGRFKARFFAGLGFSAEDLEQFDRALREQHLQRDAEPSSSDAYGQSFTIRAILRGPSGASAVVVTVWFVRTGEDRPRFVTAYPGDSK